MIESLFGYNGARCPARHEEAQSRSPSLGHHVLDPKRLQNMTILMKAVNATADQIYAALMHGECSNELPRPDASGQTRILDSFFFWARSSWSCWLVQGTACPCSNWRH